MPSSCHSARSISGPERVRHGSAGKVIVAAARRVIARDGSAALRSRAVATDVDLSHASVLHYFRTKDDLIQAVLDSVIREDIARPLVEDAEPVDPPAQLRRLLDRNRAGEGGGENSKAVMLELLRHGNSVEIRRAVTWLAAPSNGSTGEHCRSSAVVVALAWLVLRRRPSARLSHA